jgi:hypothetical protein
LPFHPEGANGKARGKECGAALKELVQSVGSDGAARDILVPMLLGDGYLVPNDRKCEFDAS